MPQIKGARAELDRLIEAIARFHSIAPEQVDDGPEFLVRLRRQATELQLAIEAYDR